VLYLDYTIYFVSLLIQFCQGASERKKLYGIPDSFVKERMGYNRSEMNLIGTAVAGKRLGVTQDRVRALIKAGRLPAKKVGRDYVIDPEDLALVKNRKPGRPRKYRK